MQEKELFNNFLEEREKSNNNDFPFFDVKCICQASLLIADSIHKGYDGNTIT